jgi:adenine-specific DNA methylase
MFQVSGEGNELDLVKQFLKTGGCEQQLGLPEIKQLPGRFAATDAPLVATETTEQALQFHIILRHPGDLIAIEQFWAIQLPTFSQGTQKSDLSSLYPSARVDLLNKAIHFLSDLVATNPFDKRDLWLRK